MLYQVLYNNYTQHHQHPASYHKRMQLQLHLELQQAYNLQHSEMRFHLTTRPTQRTWGHGALTPPLS